MVDGVSPANTTQVTTGFEDLAKEARRVLRKLLYRGNDKMAKEVAITVLEMNGQREKVKSQYLLERPVTPILIKDSNVQLLLETARHIGVYIDEEPENAASGDQV